jgi:hypothetical protein
MQQILLSGDRNLKPGKVDYLQQSFSWYFRHYESAKSWFCGWRWKILCGATTVEGSTFTNDMTKSKSMKIVTPTHFASFSKALQPATQNM